MSVDHSGHRQRLKRAMKENGLFSFSPHEVIELMLYTALPRRDVNELAHVIDDALGGVCGLMKASKEELIALGVSERTAEVLKAYTNCVNAYLNSLFRDEEKSVHIRNRGDLERLLTSLYTPGKRMLALFSSGQEMLFNCEAAGPDIARCIAEKALVYDAASAFLVCGEEDRLSKNQTEEIRKLLNLIDVSFTAYSMT